MSAQPKGNVSIQDYPIVLEWLKSTYQHQIPYFEANKQTLEALNDLLTKTKQRNEMTKVLILDAQEKTQEYKSEANRLAELLDMIGFSFTQVDHNIQSLVRSLSSIAVQLSLKDTQTPSLLIGVNDLIATQEEASTSRDNEKLLIQGLLVSTQESISKLNELQRALSSLNEQTDKHIRTAEERLRGMQYLDSKSAEYQETLQNLRSTLEGNGVSQSIYHSSLMQLQEELTKIQKSMGPKLQKLQIYNELPADVTLARMKIEEARRDLYKLEQTLTNKINEFISYTLVLENS